MAYEDRRKQYNKRLSALKLERTSGWDSHWREINDYIQPRTSRFLSSERNQGGKANQKIIDCTAGFALRTFVSGMMAGMTSPARPWFRLTTYDPALRDFKGVNVWLYDVEHRIREVIAKSNTYYVLPDCYRSLGLYGIGAFSVLPDDEEVIRCYPFPVGSFCVATSPRGIIDTIFREYSYTVEQLIRDFGKENCSVAVQNAYINGNYDQWIDIVHAVTPNKYADSEKLTAKNKSYISCWYEKNGNEEKFLRESGFNEFPVMCPRWDVLGEDVYGHSLAMEILGDAKQLQLEQKRKTEAIDKLVNPPMSADVRLRGQRASLLPGDITYVDGLSMSPHGGFRPTYEINPRIQELMVDIQECQARIKRGFYEDLMLMFATANSEVSAGITAREVEERHQEKLLALGPYMERLNNELLNKLISRIFNIMLDKGLIPPPPPELQGSQLKIEYTSVMAQAQKLIGLNGLERLVGFTANLSAVDPSAMDKLDVDQSIDEYSEMVGAPPRAVRSDDEVAERRQQRAQKEQMAQMAALAQPLQQAAQGAKSLADTNVTDVNALTRLMGAT
jgi:hypothetical protein